MPTIVAHLSGGRAGEADGQLPSEPSVSGVLRLSQAAEPIGQPINLADYESAFTKLWQETTWPVASLEAIFCILSLSLLIWKGTRGDLRSPL